MLTSSKVSAKTEALVLVALATIENTPQDTLCEQLYQLAIQCKASGREDDYYLVLQIMWAIK